MLADSALTPTLTRNRDSMMETPGFLARERALGLILAPRTTNHWRTVVWLRAASFYATKHVLLLFMLLLLLLLVCRTSNGDGEEAKTSNHYY